MDVTAGVTEADLAYKRMELGQQSHQCQQQRATRVDSAPRQALAAALRNSASAVGLHTCISNEACLKHSTGLPVTCDVRAGEQHAATSTMAIRVLHAHLRLATVARSLEAPHKAHFQLRSRKAQR